MSQTSTRSHSQPGPRRHALTRPNTHSHAPTAQGEPGAPRAHPKPSAPLTTDAHGTGCATHAGPDGMFQTLGLSNTKTRPVFQAIAGGFAAIILVGNCSIPIAIWLCGYGR